MGYDSRRGGEVVWGTEGLTNSGIVQQVRTIGEFTIKPQIVDVIIDLDNPDENTELEFTGDHHGDSTAGAGGGCIFLERADLVNAYISNNTVHVVYHVDTYYNYWGVDFTSVATISELGVTESCVSVSTGASMCYNVNTAIGPGYGGNPPWNPVVGDSIGFSYGVEIGGRLNGFGEVCLVILRFGHFDSPP